MSGVFLKGGQRVQHNRKTLCKRTRSFIAWPAQVLASLARIGNLHKPSAVAGSAWLFG